MSLSNTTYTRRLQVLFFALLSSCVTLMFHAVGLEASLYWSQWWADIVAHLLAGFSLGSFVPFFFSKHSSVFPLVIILLLIIGWEVFEVLVLGVSVTAPGYVTDVVIDVVVGFCSGFFAFRIFYR